MKTVAVRLSELQYFNPDAIISQVVVAGLANSFPKEQNK
jgi:hypothetical protein